ncbi:MAG TPA: ABC transporter permease subunit [Ilumatobacteraceae bacterium]|nr:ABC transporter permease subunit [Ilumatobacteraceae bacterium]
MTQAVPALQTPTATTAGLSRRARTTLIVFGSIVLGVIIYKITRQQDVPSWLNLHVQQHAQDAYHWITQNTGRNAVLDAIKSIGSAIEWCVDRALSLLRALNWTGVVTLVFVIGYLRAGLRTAIYASLSMFAVGLCGFWDLTMITLSIMLVAVALAMLIGVPLGIWSGLSDGAEKRLRPILDTAQVMPAYVYLIPCVAFFGIGVPAAVVATLVFAVAPAVRLTSLGLRQVPIVSTEVGLSFGSTGTQLLNKVQMPLARKTVLLGLNQVIMMAFGVVVIASQIGTGDVGGKVLAGLQKLDANLAFSAGFCIVFAAIALDRITTGERAVKHGRASKVWVADRRKLWIGGLVIVVLAALLATVLDLPDFPSWRLGIGSWAESVIDWLNENARHGVPIIGGTDSINTFIVRDILDPLRGMLQDAAWWFVVLVFAVLGWLSGGWRLATFCAVALVGIAAMDNWDLAMDTLSQVLVAVTISVCLAIPIGIWCGRSRWLETLLRPLLDTAQVLPQFVYLVPVVFLFSVGRVPGVIAAVIYALPPGIRLVSLGLREVSFAPREAAISFGATPRQELFKVQLPLAFKSIMLGINQVILMVLATVIIAGLIGGGALGLEALGGFTKPNLKMGDGVAAGVSIVLLAMILDRLTQAWGNRSAPEKRTS